MDRNNFGYVKVVAASPKEILIGDPMANAKIINEYIEKASNYPYGGGAEIIVFPELCITGYTCGDLFNQQLLLDKSIEALAKIMNCAKKYCTGAKEAIIALGMPLRKDNQLFNCAVLIKGQKILAVIPKSNIPNYNEFYEMRYFSPACLAKSNTIELLGQNVPFGSDILVQCITCEGKDFILGVEICEDAWVPITPGVMHCLAGADIILNLSASNELTAKNTYRRNLIKSLSAQEISGYVYCSASSDESTSDTVYSGYKTICENGSILVENKLLFGEDADMIEADIDIEKLRTDRARSTSYMTGPVYKDYRMVVLKDWCNRYYKNYRKVSLTPFIPQNIEERANEILSIQAMGLAQRLKKTGISKVVIGISGGLDSTLALMSCVKAFDILSLDRKGIIGITMPGFGTTKGTLNNSLSLMDCLGITSRTIDIKAACIQHLKDIEHPLDVYDVTYENVQARERTQILMDVSNMENALVIGTGDLSELALGWCTYNGDHMSMYAVNCSIPKTLVRHLVKYFADTYAKEKNGTQADKICKCLYSILETPVSPELLPPNEDGTIAQKTEDSIGNYNIHDFTLYYMLRYGFSPKKIFNLFVNSAEEDPMWGKFPKEKILKNMRIFYRRFFGQQFKRNCVPDGIKVGSISLSPRADLRMPSDATAKLWLDEIDEMLLIYDIKNKG